MVRTSTSKRNATPEKVETNKKAKKRGKFDSEQTASVANDTPQFVNKGKTRSTRSNTSKLRKVVSVKGGKTKINENQNHA